jgi:hypothetical protein
MSDEKKLALSPNEQVVAPEMSEEEKQAKADAEAYMREKHGGAPAEGGSIYDKVVKNTEDNAEDESSSSGYSPQVVGGIAGGAMAHTDALRRVGNKVLGAAPGVYDPVKVEPKLPPTATVKIEPHGPLIPHEVSGVHPEAYDTEVDKMMQSIKDEQKPTGRQMERGHNWETNRESLATKENLKTVPGAKEAVVKAGPMTPTRSGIGVPEHVARQIEEENLRKEAQRRVAEQQAKAEATAKATKEAEATKIATQKAEEEAARRGKYLGYGKGALKIGSGVLGGVMAGKDIYDLYNKPTGEQWSDEDVGKAISAGGGALMTVPTPYTELGGLALSGVGMAYPYVAPHVRKMFGGK